jgi:glyoxylase-like metal-dependent hydrolase (beta-lactamase superfamily II)
MTTLPPHPEITHLTPSCIRILAGNPSKFTLQGTNTYLLGSGPSRLLIDTGEGKPSWLAALQRTLAAENATLAGVLLTHWHRDHTGGVGDVLRAWPGTRVYKHRQLGGLGGEEGDGHGEEEGEGGRWLDIADGQRFAVDGASLTAVHTPGHTADHMVLAWGEEGALFTGDNVLGHGTSVFEDLGAYVASLERMRGLFGGPGGSGRAYPGHGPVVEAGRGKVEEYIRHRGQREEQVVQMLRGEGNVEVTGDGRGGGAWTVMELVRSIYTDIPEALYPAAAGGVVQILQKLQREGKAVVVDGEEEDRWRLVGSAGSGRSAL